MNPIIQGIEAGYSPEEMLEYISKSLPSLVPKITRAMSKGYGIKEILGFLAQSTPQSKQSTKGLSEIEIQNRSQEQQGQLVKNGLIAAGSAIAAPLGMNMARSALSRALPRSVANGALSSLPIPSNINPDEAPTLNMPLAPTLGMPQEQNNSVSSTQQPPVNQTPNNVSQAPNIEQPKEKTNISEILWKDLEKGSGKSFGFESDAFMKVARRMKSTGEIRSPEDLESFFNLFNQKQKEGKNLPTALKEASAEYTNQKLPSEETTNLQPKTTGLVEEKIIDLGGMGKGMTDNLYNGLFESLKKGSTKFAGIEDPLLKRAKEPFEKGLIKSPDDLRKFANEKPIEQPKIEENIVATPNGFGEVKISRNGTSLVEVDGKKHSVEDSKILKPPKEAAIEAMELIKSFTPEEMRSTHHMLNSYDEEEKKGFFVFHNGEAYVVDDISPAEYEELSKEVADAKTSGETIIGKWAKGHGSRGAGYNKVVKGHRDRKVVPELVKKFRKLKVGYNLLSEWQRLLNEK